MEIENVRTGFETYDKDRIKLCKHITLICDKYDNDDGCEYISNVPIKCEICKKVHKINVLIN